MLREELRIKLLGIARQAIAGKLAEGKVPSFSTADPELLEPRAAFVTLQKRGLLRGCIGYTEPLYPLYQAVASCAVSAAFSDSRFPPLRKEELQELQIEISVLTPLKKIQHIEEISVGRDGLFIVKGSHCGLLLPQVATEHGWDRETFLGQACHKAGLPSDAWKKGAEIHTFSAEIFHE